MAGRRDVGGTKGNRTMIVAIGAGIGVLAVILVAFMAVDQGQGDGLNDMADMVIVDDREENSSSNSTDTDPKPSQDEIEERLDEIERTASENTDYSPAPREWLTSGPFQIDRSQYLLGEKIFLRIGELGWQEKGSVVFLRPLNDTHYSVYQTVPFDGSEKTGFNYYVQPAPSKAAGLCSADDLVGEWAVVFRGTDHPSLKFEITDGILPGDEERYGQTVC